jgi:hypothetical protein
MTRKGWDDPQSGSTRTKQKQVKQTKKTNTENTTIIKTVDNIVVYF